MNTGRKGRSWLDVAAVIVDLAYLQSTVLFCKINTGRNGRKSTAQ